MTPKLITASIILITSMFQSGFISEQKKFPRVRGAIDEKQKTVDDILRTKNLNVKNFELLFVAYKNKDLLEVYTKKKDDAKFSKVHSYAICARSGQLGPKRKQGDFQIPEGFYHINRFNPSSKFHLSLGINYPNNADRKKSKSSNLGGDIFIHGACMTIGCLPMTDDKIKEIYLLSIHAKNNGQKNIPVYIFPFEMTDKNMQKYESQFNNDLKDFWTNLKIGYDRFQTDGKALDFSVDENGDYQFRY